MEVNEVTDRLTLATYLQELSQNKLFLAHRKEVSWYIENMSDMLLHSAAGKLYDDADSQSWQHIAFFVMASIRHMNVGDGLETGGYLDEPWRTDPPRR
jgi:hypothetical protein